MNAEIISVGTELLLGHTINTDAAFVARELSAIGVNLLFACTVGDNPGRLRDALEEALGRSDVVITTGGLGPTDDDLTKETIASVAGAPLKIHEDSLRRLESYFKGRPAMGENQRKQAMLPEGCTVLDNDWGTAPGVAFEADGVRVIMLPGPPRECRAMFTHRVIPYLKSLADGVIVSRTLKLFGIGESSMEAQLREEMEAMTNPTLAPYAKEGECELRITAKAADEESARALIAPVEERLRARFGPLIYGADVPSLEAAVFQLLKEKGLTLGCAESCTGGLIAKRMTDLSGVSAVFRGGVVSYATEVKLTVLGVEQALLDEFGAVSEPVARAMAEGARRVLGCDLAVASTGVAGPDPDERGNPVGLVYLALAAPDGTWVRKIQQGLGRERVRHVSASHAFDLTRRYLSGLEVK